MFGTGTFAEKTFGQFLSASNILLVTTMTVTVTLSDVLGIITTPVDPLEVEVVLYDVIYAQNVTGQFALSGEATVEFVGTTQWVDMVEQGRSHLGIAAEIRTRSL